MATADYIVLSIILVFIASGIYINFFRDKKNPGFEEKPEGNSLVVFRVMVPLAIIASIVIYFGKWGSFELPILGWIGGAMVLAGLLIRWIAVASLGQAFRVDLCIIEDQELKTDGLYRLIRNPSYTGMLLYYTGLGLVMQNYICVAILPAGAWFSIVYRIQREEKLLLDHFGETYRAYIQRSYKLIPYIY